MKISIIFKWFIVLMWKHLNFQLFCFCYSVVYVRTVFTEAQPGPTLTALYFEIAYSLLRKIPEREFQILTLMNFHEPLEIKYNFQRPSSSDSPLRIRNAKYFAKHTWNFIDTSVSIEHLWFSHNQNECCNKMVHMNENLTNRYIFF